MSTKGRKKCLRQLREIGITFDPKTDVILYFAIFLKNKKDRNDDTVNVEELKDALLVENNVSDQDVIDVIVGAVTLKYTQSNSVCFTKNGQVIGIAAGQQSRLHATKLARDKAQNWWLRQQDPILNLPFKNGLKRFERINAVDYYLSHMLTEQNWSTSFTSMPTRFQDEVY